jgi:hypothetical protein
MGKSVFNASEGIAYLCFRFTQKALKWAEIAENVGIEERYTGNEL